MAGLTSSASTRPSRKGSRSSSSLSSSSSYQLSMGMPLDSWYPNACDSSSMPSAHEMSTAHHIHQHLQDLLHTDEAHCNSMYKPLWREADSE